MRNALIGIVLAIALSGTVATLALWRERSFNRCALTPPTEQDSYQGSGYHVRWDWTPPGWVCVYTDPGGRAVLEGASVMFR